MADTSDIIRDDAGDAAADGHGERQADRRQRGHSRGHGSHGRSRRRHEHTGRPSERDGGAEGERGTKAPTQSAGDQRRPDRQRDAATDDTDIRRALHRMFSVRSGRASYEAIRKRVLDGSKLDGMHVWALVSAMLIASIGLNINSTEAIVGSMLICPIMGFVLALSYAIATLDVPMLRRSAGILAAQLAICFVTSTLYFLFSPLSGATEAIASNSTPTIWDVLIAFVGGFAGSLGTSRKNSPYTLVSGVAVATSLMPPLCTTGYGLATGSLVLMASAFYEFLVNVVFITFGSELVFVMLRLPLRYEDLDGDGVIDETDRSRVARKARRMRRWLAVGTIAFAVPCVLVSANVVQKSFEETGTVFEVLDQYDTERTTRELESVCPELSGYSIGAEDSYDIGSDTIRQRVVASVVTIREPDDETREQVESLIRINVPTVEEVRFSVTDDPRALSGTERIL